MSCNVCAARWSRSRWRRRSPENPRREVILDVVSTCRRECDGPRVGGVFNELLTMESLDDVFPVVRRIPCLNPSADGRLADGAGRGVEQ